MDTISDREFIKVFHRVATYINLGRSRNPDEIDSRMRRILKLMRKASRTAARGSTIKKWRSRHNNLRTLYRHAFAERLWKEGINKPSSIYGLTLVYGYDNAVKIIKAAIQKRRPLVRVTSRRGRRTILRGGG